MKVSGVGAANGSVVTLLFVREGVHVLDGVMYGGRMYRLAGAAVFAAFAMAATGLGVGHAVDPALGIGLSFAALLLAVSAGVGAGVVWTLVASMDRRRRRGVVAPIIAADSVMWARSGPDAQGVVNVVLGLTDGSIRQFSAAGMKGAELAFQFGALLRITEDHQRIEEDAQQAKQLRRDRPAAPSTVAVDESQVH